jgi:hypothetical protein
MPLFYGQQWIRDFLHEIEQVFSGSSPFKAAAMLHRGKEYGRLFHDQVILYGFNSWDALCELTRFVDGLLRINEAAQLNDALVSFDTDLVE